MAGSGSNIERFLGSAAGRGGPFALLGIAPEASDSASVIAALERRLDEVNSHAHSETPQADEVRLALHAGAAQMLDPVVRRHMLQRWGGGAGAAPAPPGTTMPSSEALALERDAILTLGMYGGWNRASLRRIALLAHARGVPSHRVADAIHAIAHRRTRRALQPSDPAPDRAPPAAREIHSDIPPSNGATQPRASNAASRRPPELEPMLEPHEADASGGVKLVVGVLLIVVIAAVSLLGVLAMLWESNSQPHESDDSTMPSQQQRAQATPQQSAGQSSTASAAQQDTLEPESLTLAESVERAREALAIDPDQGVREMLLVVDQLETTWPTLTPDERTRTHAEIIDFLYRVSSRPDRARVLAERIAGGVRDFDGVEAPGASDVSRGAWSSGMLVRLTRESNLPVSVSTVIDLSIARTYAGARPPQDATFVRGAIDFLARVPPSLLEWPDDQKQAEHAWEAWIIAAKATAGSTGDLAGLLVLGLDQILRDGPEPTRRAWPLPVVQRIVESLSWEQGAPARTWLVSAFNAPALTSADLFAVTSALAKRRDIEGVDPTMTLDAQASERARAELRDRYASAWGLLDATQSDDVLADLTRAVGRAQREADTALTQEEHLAATTRLAMLNQAAALAWRGEIKRALTTMDGIDDAIDNAIDSASASGGRLSESGSGDWALRYLSIRNQQARLDLLDGLARRSSSSTLDVMDAEVLVREALRGDRAAVRRRAHQIVRQFTSQAAIINAMLEELPHVPESRVNVALLSDAAGIRTLDPSDPQWRVSARRGLVERLLQLVAGESPEASIDRLSYAIAGAYAQRASATLDVDAGVEADTAAFELRSRWRRRAANVLSTAALSLERIERDRLGRVSSARGPVQVFAAEQLAAAELMAYVVMGERAGVGEEVGEILDEMERRRQGARHIFEQLAAVEGAMAELWLIRLRD